MKGLIKVTKALSDPGRIKIIKLLGQRELCVCELRAALGLAQPTVSKHLGILEAAGLIRRRKEGLWVNYSLAGDGSPYAAELLRLLRGWLADDPEIRTLLAELPGIHRESICGSNSRFRGQKTEDRRQKPESRGQETVG